MQITVVTKSLSTLKSIKQDKYLKQKNSGPRQTGNLQVMQAGTFMKSNARIQNYT